MKKTPKAIPAKLRREVKERDNDTCQMCGRPGDSIHHIISSGMGRRRQHFLTNLVFLCVWCHDRVHNSKDSEKLQRQLEEWAFEKYGEDFTAVKIRAKGWSWRSAI